MIMGKKNVSIEQAESLGLTQDEALIRRHKLPTEHFLGWGTYVLRDLLVRSYKGTTSKPLKVTPIEQSIIKLLERRQGWSADELCEVLGLDPEDRAERGLLQSALDGLRDARKAAIEGDETYICLTEKGQQFAREGEVPEQYETEFSLLYWGEQPRILLPKKIADTIKKGCKQREQSSDSRRELPLSKEDGLRIIEEQAPNVHCPKERYILDVSSLSFVREYPELQYELGVAVLYNRVTSGARLLLYDKGDDKGDDVVLRELSEYLSQDVDLVARYVQEVSEKVEQEIQELREYYGDESVEQCLSDKAIGVEASVLDGEQLQKTLFDTHEFEDELGCIFSDKKNRAIWLISPWIKKGAFSSQRYRQIDNFLSQSNSSRVYLIYSMPEGEHSVMMDDVSDEHLQKLVKKYGGRIAAAQFPNFHYKEVIVEGQDGDMTIYSGSFNILSFTGLGQGNSTIRAERMTRLLNPQEIAKEYDYFKDNFENYKLTGQSQIENENLSLATLKQKLIQIRSENSPRLNLTADTLERAKTFVGPQYASLKTSKELIYFLIGACCASVCMSMDEKPSFVKNRDVYLNTLITKNKQFKGLKVINLGGECWVLEYSGLAFEVQNFTPSSKALSALPKLAKEPVAGYSKQTWQGYLNELVALLSNNEFNV